LIALIFGSSAAISFGLMATTIVFLVLKNEQPQLAYELPALIRSCSGFLILTALSGSCLYATLKERRWQWGAQAAMWIALATIVYIHWPK
jgi:hypothetical protein